MWPALKWATFLAVLIFVGQHGYKLWRDVDERTTPFKWGWLVLASGASVLAWMPSAWFWRRLMSDLGYSSPWPQIIRSHYCGQLGKYVPGKAAVIVIRAALISGAAVPAPVASLTVVVESLTYLWAGALLAILLFPWLAAHLPAEVATLATTPLSRVLLLILVLAGGLAGMRVLFRSYRQLANLFRRPDVGAAPADPPSIPVRSLVIGVAVFLAAWWMQGIVLGLTIQAVSPEPVDWGDLPFWTGTVAVAVVGGFVAIFSPGGLGVREGLLMELLSPQLGPHQAVLVAVLLRGVMLAGEIAATVALYWGVAGPKRGKASKGQTA
jgi:uncharacterized membrane protein YbhN (UPF0104 family)